MPAAAHPNREIADELREMSRLLEAQGANPFRVRAYRNAAATVAELEQGVDEIFERGGRAALEDLPGVGRGIATAIESLLRTGRMPQLERLRGQADPEALFAEIPGIGPKLAAAIHDELHVDSLEALEVAAHDGRLQNVSGMGPRRAQAVRAVLAERLARRPLGGGAGAAAARAGPGQAGPHADGPHQAASLQAGLRTAATAAPSARPSVAALLAADAEYRRRAAAGELPTITPRRFNPQHRSWLPVLHTEQEGWHMTLLYSNTARAHELGRTQDWVVIYYYDDDHTEGQCTVVTETRGAHAGERVVRGRENER
ncbi:MAG: helix-hairpin-helix domain-containing protein [Pseudomonadales bacterium]